MDKSFYKVLNIKVSEHKSSFGGTQRRKSYRSNCRKQQAASRVSRTPLPCPEVNSPVSLTPQEENKVGAEGTTYKMLTWDGIRAKGTLDQGPGRRKILWWSAFLKSHRLRCLPTSVISILVFQWVWIHGRKKGGGCLGASQMSGLSGNIIM